MHAEPYIKLKHLKHLKTLYDNIYLINGAIKEQKYHTNVSYLYPVNDDSEYKY